MSIKCHLLPLTVRIAEVIHVNAARGDGTPENPTRSVNVYYSKEGEMLACFDPLNGPPDSFETLRSLMGDSKGTNQAKGA